MKKVEINMKTTKLIVTIGCLISLLLTSCGDFDGMNNDPNRLDEVNPGTLLNPILYEMACFNWSRANSYTFDLMQVTTPTNSTGGVSRYYMSDAAGNSSWNTYYKWFNNAREMEVIAKELEEPNYESIAILLQSWMIHLLTDCFGDVPMEEAGRAEEGFLQLRFDSQKDIYEKLIERLEYANDNFDLTIGLRYNTSGELLFKTDATSANIIKWKKFCNSLALRVLLRALDRDGELAIAQKLKDRFADSEKYPVFESNEEAAFLEISGVFPEEAPMTRPQDFTSYRAVTSFFINNLNEWEDPRRSIYCSTVTDTETGVTGYVGWPSGYAIVPSYSASNVRQTLATAPMKIVFMNYAEVEFIKAELGFKNVVSGIDVQQSYENGIAATLEQWGATVPAGFFDRNGVKFENTFEQIMLHKYYALFFCDYQQWFEHLRTGYPVMVRGAGVPESHKMPCRFKYPESVQRINRNNYLQAVENMGGDDFNTQLWWQK